MSVCTSDDSHTKTRPDNKHRQDRDSLGERLGCCLLMTSMELLLPKRGGDDTEAREKKRLNLGACESAYTYVSFEFGENDNHDIALF